jgi:ATP synthase protein I
MRVNPILSLWRVVGAQALVGILVAVVAGYFFGQASIGYSALYGAMAVCLPSAVFARGLTSRFSSANPSSAVMGFFVWEMAKVGLTVAMLFAAPRVVTDLSWPAMLGGLVVTMKVYWLALGMRRVFYR